MKRLIILALSIVFLVMFVGCSGNGVIPPPVDEPPIDLIREYTGRDFVTRWEGEVFVYNFSLDYEIVETVLKTVNTAITSNVFQLCQDSSLARLKLNYFVGLESLYEVNIAESNSLFSSGTIYIDLEQSLSLEKIFLEATLVVAGISEEKASLGLTEEVKEVLYWLYRLEPGYPLS